MERKTTLSDRAALQAHSYAIDSYLRRSSKRVSEEEAFGRNIPLSPSLFIPSIDDVFVKRVAVLKTSQLYNFRDGVFFGDIQHPGAFELAWKS